MGTSREETFNNLHHLITRLFPLLEILEFHINAWRRIKLNRKDFFISVSAVLIIEKQKVDKFYETFWLVIYEKMEWFRSLSLHKKMKFSIKDFFSKCDQICSCLWNWSHLLKKFLIENFFCAVSRALEFCSLEFS